MQIIIISNNKNYDYNNQKKVNNNNRNSNIKTKSTNTIRHYTASSSNVSENKISTTKILAITTITIVLVQQ